MNILALDNSSDTGTVGLWCDGVMRFDARFSAGRGEGGALFAALRDALALCPVPNRIVTGLGPGSYSGIRVAVSAAYGIELGTRAALTGLPSVVALDVPEECYTVVGDVRRGSFFYASVRECALAQPITLVSPEEWEEISSRSDAPVYTLDSRVLEGAEAAVVSAEKLALFCSRIADGNLPPIGTRLEPLYLKPPHITAPNGLAAL